MFMFEVGCVMPLALLLGLGLIGLHYTLLLLGVVWQVVHDWIDDYENPMKRNPVLKFCMRLLGYSEADHWSVWSYKNKSGNGSDGEIVTLGGLLLGFIPMLVVLMVAFYPVTLTLITLFIIAKLARFVVRHKKLFDKHIKAKDAHK